MENHETVTSNTDVLVKNHKLDDTDWDYRYIVYCIVFIFILFVRKCIVPNL